MADLDFTKTGMQVVLSGSDATGAETNEVNADSNGNLFVKDYSNGPVIPGTAAAVSSLVGAQYNTALPTLTAAQQAALQVDSSGRLIIRPLTVADVVSAAQSGTWNITNITGTISLPTGAATSANQTTEITALQMLDNPIGSSTGGAAGTSSFLVGGIYNSSLPALTSGQQSALQIASNGSLLVQNPNNVSTVVAFNALNSTVTLAMIGLTSCGFQLAAGTFIGTLTPQCSIDGGATWTNISFLLPVTQSSVPTYTFSSANPATVLSLLPMGGSTHCRVVVTSYSSGTANASMTASEITISTGSTASVATDLAGNGNITGLGQTVTAVLHGCAAMVWDIQGTFSATVTFEATVNGGTDWFPIQGIYAPYNTVSGVWSAVAQVIISCGGYQQVRARCTSYSSGTMSLYWDASAGSNFAWSYVYNQQPANLQVMNNATITSLSYPSPYNYNSYTGAPLTQDTSGNLQIRGPILTDEGSFRDDFSGAALFTTISGTASFTNGSKVVSGSGTSFTTQVGVGQYLKLAGDANSAYAQVYTVNNDTSITLLTPYTGSTSTNTTVVSNWTSSVFGTHTVANSLDSLSSGTTVGTVSLFKSVDYSPLSTSFYASISQRIANQTGFLGIGDVVYPGTNMGAYVTFTGTNNTQVNFVTQSSTAASDIQTTLVTLPNGGTTNSYHYYKIDLSHDIATLSIDGIVVATNSIHVPLLYVTLGAMAGINNAATVTATMLAIDMVYVLNFDRLQIDDNFPGEPLNVQGQVASGNIDSSNSLKVGGVYNASAPTLTTGQKADLQLDTNGNLKVTGSLSVGSVTVSNFPAIQAVSQSGVWSTGRTWALSSGTDTVAVSQSGTWNLTNITGTISLPTGAATAANQATEITSLQILDNPVGPVSPGTAGTNSFLIGGQFNSTVPSLATTQQAAIQLDARGAQQVTLLDGCRATYSATSAIAFASAASPTDIFTITGSNSKTVRILRIGFSATQTTAGTVNVLLIKRFSANAGGTSAAATSVPHDSTDSAATATVLNYTANPTSLGTSVGTVRAVRAFIPTTGTAAASQYYEFDVGDRAEKAIILRGNTQVLSVNLNSTTVSGGLWTIWVEWTEE